MWLMEGVWKLMGEAQKLFISAEVGIEKNWKVYYKSLKFPNKQEGHNEGHWKTLKGHK